MTCNWNRCKRCGKVSKSEYCIKCKRKLSYRKIIQKEDKLNEARNNQSQTYWKAFLYLYRVQKLYTYKEVEKKTGEYKCNKCGEEGHLAVID